jgi:hypothetical protein
VNRAKDLLTTIVLAWVGCGKPLYVTWRLLCIFCKRQNRTAKHANHAKEDAKPFLLVSVFGYFIAMPSGLPSQNAN